MFKCSCGVFFRANLSGLSGPEEQESMYLVDWQVASGMGGLFGKSNLSAPVLQARHLAGRKFKVKALEILMIQRIWIERSYDMDQV